MAGVSGAAGIEVPVFDGGVGGPEMGCSYGLEPGFANPFYPLDCPVNLSGSAIVDPSDGVVTVEGALAVNKSVGNAASVWNKSWTNWTLVNQTGDIMTGILDMKQNGIRDVGNLGGVQTGSQPTVMANKEYVDAMSIKKRGCTWRDGDYVSDHNMVNMCRDGEVMFGAAVRPESQCAGDVLYGAEGCMHTYCCEVYIETPDGDTPPEPTPMPDARDDYAVLESGDSGYSQRILVLANDYPDGVSIVSATEPEQGTTSIDGDAIEYELSGSFSGEDSFSYTIENAEGQDSAQVTVSENRPPTANDDTYLVQASDTLEVPAPGVIENDDDPDGDTLTVSVVTSPSGTLDLSQDGGFTFTPASGSDDSFQYELYDGAATDQATVTLQVNQQPQTVDDSYTVTEGDTLSVSTADGVLDNDDDPDGDDLRASVATEPSYATSFSLNTYGSFTYEPSGSIDDSFTYNASDGNGGWSLGDASITVEANAAPVAVDDDDVTTQKDTATTVQVLDNDYDNDDDSFGVVDTTSPGDGSVSVSADNTAITYTPDSGYTGEDSFTYDIEDEHGKTDTATVSVTVEDPNEPPSTTDDTASVTKGESVTIDVLSNDEDPDGTDSNMIVSSTGSPSAGSVDRVNGNTEIDFDATGTSAGTEYTFSYTAEDEGDATATAEVTVTVNEDNNPPNAADVDADASNDWYVTPPGETITLDVTHNDNDPDGDPITIDSTSGVSDGTATINGNEIDYISLSSGVKEFDYTISDDEGATDSATVTVFVGLPVENGLDVSWNNSGEDLFALREEDHEKYAVRHWDVSDAFEISAVGETREESFNQLDEKQVHGIEVSLSDNGYKLHFIGSTESTTPELKIWEYDLGSVDDISSASFNQEWTGPELPYSNAEGKDITWRPDGESFVAIDSDYNAYDISVDSAYTLDNPTVDIDEKDLYDFGMTEDQCNFADSIDFVDDGDYLLTASWDAGGTPSEKCILSYPVSPSYDVDSADSRTLERMGLQWASVAEGMDVDNDEDTVYEIGDYGPGMIVQLPTKLGCRSSLIEKATLQRKSVAWFLLSCIPMYNRSNTMDEMIAADRCARWEIVVSICILFAAVAGAAGVEVPVFDGGVGGPEMGCSFGGDPGFVNPFYPLDCPLNLSGSAIVDPSDGVVTVEGALAVNKSVGNAASVWNKSWTNWTLVNQTGDIMTGLLDMKRNGIQNTGEITGVQTGSQASMLAKKGYVDAMSIEKGSCAWRDGNYYGDHNMVNMCRDGEVMFGAAVRPESQCAGDVLYGAEGCMHTYCCEVYVETPDGDGPSGLVAEPEARQEFRSMGEEGDDELTIDVLANDYPSGLTIESVGSPSYGTATIDSGSIVYTLTGPLSGDDTFSYTVSNSEGQDTADITVSRNVLEAVEDDYTVQVDESLDKDAPGVTANDNDPEGDTLAVEQIDDPDSTDPKGSVTVEELGGFEYDPVGSSDPDYGKDDTFMYEVYDGKDRDNATVNIRVNRDPDAVDDTGADEYSVREGGSLSVTPDGVLGNDNDADGDDLEAELVSGPSEEDSFSLDSDGSFDYTPAGATDDSFTYRAVDGYGGEDTADVDIHVEPNAEPVASDDSYEVDEYESLSVTPDGVLGNDNDADGDDLEAELVSGPSEEDSFSLDSDGSFDYTPAGATDDSFTYRATDGYGGEDTASVDITVDPNSDPNVNSDSASTYKNSDETISVLGNDGDPDGDSISLDSASGASDGSVSVSGDDVEYTPDSGFSGTDSFTYSISDEHGASDSASVTVTVTNRDPNANSDSASTVEDSSVTISVLGNDGDPDGDSISLDSASGASDGSVSVSGDDVEYTPDSGFSGTDSFTYSISDGDGGTDSASVTVTVNDEGGKVKI